MLKELSFLLFFFSTLSYPQNNNDNIILIDSSYSNSFEKPLLILSGQLVNFQADSIYLVNKPRLTLYEDIRRTLMTLDLDCEHAISLYRESIEQNHLIADKLIMNSSNIQHLHRKTFTDTKLLLNRNKESLNKSIDNLESAQINLEKIKEEIDRIETNTFFDNLLYGLAGVGVGILVGISL